MLLSRDHSRIKSKGGVKKSKNTIIMDADVVNVTSMAGVLFLNSILHKSCECFVQRSQIFIDHK